MPIIELQRRLQEAGRIRIGRQVETRGGKKRPAALDTFRLTSPDRTRIAAAAKLYGGPVTTWAAPSGQEHYEVITETDRLPVVVPPSILAFSQWMEQWSAGGCKRRCDGVTEQISDQNCLCNPESPACEPHTRLSLLLSEVPGLGLWRLDTQGYYAAHELQGAVDIITIAAGKGQMLPATLRLEQRSVKRTEEGVKHFVVPVLDIDLTPAQLLMGTVSVQPQRALTPVPDDGPPPSIAEQMKAADDIPSRRRKSTPAIPATGIAPRTAAQVAQTQAPERDETGEGTQDPPRMATPAQLTKLGILLKEQGFDSSPDGRAGRLDWCMSAIRRRISSAKELTFDEASMLISTLMETGLEEGISKARGEDRSAEPPAEEESGELPLDVPKEQTIARPTNSQLTTIRQLYEAKEITGQAMLAEITLFLQREQPLAGLHKLTREETEAVLGELQGETT